MALFVSKSRAGLPSTPERSQNRAFLSKRWLSQQPDQAFWWSESIHVHTCANPSGRTLSVCVSEYMSVILQNKTGGNFPPASTEVSVPPTTDVPRGLMLQKWRGWDDLIAWPASPFSSGLSPGLCKGSYRSATQNLHLKRNPSAMSAWTKYSVRFTSLWSWPPPGYFWPQGQLQQCGPWNVICKLKPNVDLFRAKERQCSVLGRILCCVETNSLAAGQKAGPPSAFCAMSVCSRGANCRTELSSFGLPRAGSTPGSSAGVLMARGTWQ